MSLIGPSIILSVLFIIVGIALLYTGFSGGFFLGILICAISSIIYGVFCLICIKKAANDITKFYANSPIYLGLLIAILLGSLGLYSGILNLTELLVMLTLLIINAVLIRKLGFAKNT